MYGHTTLITISYPVNKSTNQHHSLLDKHKHKPAVYFWKGLLKSNLCRMAAGRRRHPLQPLEEEEEECDL